MLSLALVDLSEFLCLWHHFLMLFVFVLFFFKGQVLIRLAFLPFRTCFEQFCLRMPHCCTAVFCQYDVTE